MDIKKLVETFSKHEIQAEKDSKRLLKEFKKNYPEAPIPKHFKDDFCIARSLKEICMEIVSIKEKLGME